MIFRYQHQGQAYTVQIEVISEAVYQIRIEDREYHVQASDWSEHVRRLLVDGQKHIASTAADQRVRWIQLDGASPVALQTAEPQSQRRARGTGGPAQLNAQMPGQVVDVLVAVGDRVKAGQVVALLEAMKMEIRVTAPYDGLVEQVYVAKGDVVERDQSLIDMTAADSGDTAGD